MLNPHPHLMAYYPLHGPPSDRSREHDASRDLTVTGAVQVDGRFGSAYSIDATNDYLESGFLTGLPAVAPVTICMWIYLNNLPGGGTARCPLSYGNESPGSKCIQPYANPTGATWAISNNGAGVNTGWAYRVGWQHLAVRAFSSTTADIVFDGRLDGASPFSIAMVPTNPYIHIGGLQQAKGNSLYTWDGLIEEVSIWDVALSSENIRAIMHGGNPTL